MSRINFSLSDYQKSLSAGLYKSPNSLGQYFDIDRSLFHQYGVTKKRRGKFRKAMDELQKRTGKQYFSKYYPLQAITLQYSKRTFPAYKFILPEVMTEDWLATVDWGKFQRDHILHQPLCGYIVLKLLDGSGKSGPLHLPNGSTILEACVDNILRWDQTDYIRKFLIDCGMSKDDDILKTKSLIAKNVWRGFFREAAFVAAIFHDIGYPWQYAERIQDNIDGMYSPAIKENRNASEVIEQYGHRLLFNALRGYQKEDSACPSTWKSKLKTLTNSALSKTHGLPGALGFLHLNDSIRRFPLRGQSPLHLLCVEWVATAIMMHDLSKIYWGEDESKTATPENPFLRLNFASDPLSALVTLVDVIEDFERPAVGYHHVGRKGVLLKYNTASSATNLEIDPTGVLTIRYKTTTAEHQIEKKKHLRKERREMFDIHHGYLNMQSLGINEVRLLAS